MKNDDIFIECDEAQQLILKLKYDKIYTEKVRSNGGNSAKISCPKKYIDSEVVVFVLKKKKGDKNETK
jgi:putative transposon-encoded protein